jgi:hypothetical protein
MGTSQNFSVMYVGMRLTSRYLFWSNKIHHGKETMHSGEVQSEISGRSLHSSIGACGKAKSSQAIIA